MAKPEEIPVVSYTWTNPDCEDGYRYCIEQIRLIQERARREIEPWSKRATEFYSLGTTIRAVHLVKP